jgi:hypothetical protein
MKKLFGIAILLVLLQGCAEYSSSYHPGYYQGVRWHHGRCIEPYYDAYGNYHPAHCRPGYYDEGRWHRGYTTYEERYYDNRDSAYHDNGYPSSSSNSTATGAVVGAITGAAVGAAAGGGDAGSTLLGAGVGAVVGGAVGNQYEDR